MRIKMVIERKDGKKVEVPFTWDELSDISDVCYMVDPETIKLNKMTKTLASAHEKIEFIVNDVVSDGKVYQLIDDKKTGKAKAVLAKEKHYLVRKPVWK